MEREKMIEEMATHICDFGDCKKCVLENKCNYFVMAKRLYSLGYRKIPDGAVVLTREEYEELKHEQHLVFLDRVKLVSDAEEKTRKETAREILRELSKVKYAGSDFCSMLAEKYGVEVE